MKLIFIAFIVFFLSSCNHNLKVSYELDESLTQVFALCEEDKVVKSIKIDYDIKTEEDVFLLYTIFQNNLPLGYVSPAHANITLLQCKIENDNIYYYVDSFIFLSSDISLFLEILTKTNQLYGYGTAHVFYNEREIV